MNEKQCGLMLPGFQGLLIGDKGYINSFQQQELQRYGINLQTTLHSNRHDVRSPSWVRVIYKP